MHRLPIIAAQQQSAWWKSPADRAGDRETPPPPELTRRGFLEAAGFTLSLAALGGCERAPVVTALPWNQQPEGRRPGRSFHYATTCGGCPAGCGMIAAVRDGRPLKLEGLPQHPLSQGGLCAVGQASPLGLYDSRRLRLPAHRGQELAWDEADAQVTAALQAIAAAGQAVRVVTPTVTSPTLQRTLERFLAGFSDARHVTFDSVSASAILDAHELTHGRRVLPRYRLDRARVIVALDADFLGAWIAPVEHAAAWARQRHLPAVGLAPHGAAPAAHDASTPAAAAELVAHAEHAAHAAPPVPDAQLSYHVQIESRYTLTGSNADRRYPVHPSEIGMVAACLWQRIDPDHADIVAGPPPLPAEQLDALAAQLIAHRGASLVMCGSQDLAAQTLVNRINAALGNYGATLDVEAPSRQRQSDDAGMLRLLDEVRTGGVHALIAVGVDLTYHLPQDAALAAALERTPLKIAVVERMDDFASRADYVFPDQHTLESWLDAEPVEGLCSIRQPLVSPLAAARGALETFAAWAGQPSSALDLVRERWRAEAFPRQTTHADFDAFWDQTLRDGFVALAQGESAESAPPAAPSDPATWPSYAEPTDALTLVLHAVPALPDARHAHNAWLQELPDPVTKLTWDNCAALSPALARDIGVIDGDVVRITAGDATLELPAFIQPGQHPRTVAVALHYGVPGTERFTDIGPQWLEALPTVEPGGRVGVNAAPLGTWEGGRLQPLRSSVTVAKTGRRRALATTQLHDAIETPPSASPPGAETRAALAQETTLAEFRACAAAGAPAAHHALEPLWPDDHRVDAGRRWGLAIDLNRCTGCSACLIACQAENNVPVVGRDEVRRHREMHWLRIDRYYRGDEANPDAIHQPMMCQHCGNAPCETVCPVLATVHSSEGLNQQVYNRCVGTRYCANNCPYKVRRFNWFDYARDGLLENLALNPDVTVRMRGVMEKCSLCVQRIQEAKYESKRLGAPLSDGAIQTACQQSCPTSAIVFGDLNDPQSRAAQAMRDARRFIVLEELNVQPNVGYLRKVRNLS